MLFSKNKEISNWGNYPSHIADEYVFENQTDFEELKNIETTILARGNGRCYGDAALNDTVISTLKLNHFLDFNENKGIITCQSGVLFSEILAFIIPKGYFLPVTPGTKFITVGGAIAADVHGKNHHKEGCFSEFVESFNLITDNGEHLNCSRNENATLFWETIGGMGLTGIITQATFSLKKIENAYIYLESIKAKNLDEILQLFKESENWTYTVAWIDCLQTGKNIGRSILMRGEHASSNRLKNAQTKNPFKTHSNRNIKVPFYFPTFFLNKLSVKAFNFLYYNKQIKKVKKAIVHYDPFFYPLDSLLEWNKIYGKKGFIQYQFVLPESAGTEGLKKILQTIAKSGQGSFLAVLKVFGAHNPKAINSFPFKGLTLALDFKVNRNLFELIKKLDFIVKTYNGRIYRAKDSLSDKALLNYINVKSKKFNSIQNQRINQK